ncbi:hypothetical protein Pth03_56780 [Planotetraspora thailandica]|uniref:Uncharacterized protein n=1 Tax=Planotetraspora thailandica TaxID=487172 RepID=A0A8J3XXZ7_9ACTN|nr:hypothetical protein Pth03_56780 [Planotetraspora thailandica]
MTCIAKLRKVANRLPANRRGIMIKTFAIALLLAVAGLIGFGLIMARREQSHRRPMTRRR